MDSQDEVINNNNNTNNINNNNNNIGAGHQSIVKGKRTKRQRPHSPIPFRMITTTNNSYKSDEGSDICSNNNNNNNNNNNVVEEMTTATTTTTTIVSDDDENYFNGVCTAGSTTEEEEDMANCLILLAQGHSRDLLVPQQNPPLLSLVNDGAVDNKVNNHSIPANGTNNKFISRKFMEASTAGKSGYYVYECKTCGKTFQSFQALGGHRASHKKPKNKDEDYSSKIRHNSIFNSIITSSSNNRNSNNNYNSSLINNNTNNNNYSSLLLSSDDEEPPFKVARHNNNITASSTSLSLQLTNRALYNSSISNHHSSNKGRVHECSICGAEFSSGQALGGHMRRHRGPVSAATASATPVIRAVPLTIEQAVPEMSLEQMMISAMKIPPVRNTNTTSSSVLSLDLDLNLPAPPEDNNNNIVDDHQSKFVFESKQSSNEQQQQPPSPPLQQQQQQQPQQLVFSSPALVDCHY